MGDLNVNKPSAEIMFLQEERPFIKEKEKRKRRNDQAASAFNHVTRKTNACDYGKSQQ